MRLLIRSRLPKLWHMPAGSGRARRSRLAAYCLEDQLQLQKAWRALMDYFVRGGISLQRLGYSARLWDAALEGFVKKSFDTSWVAWGTAI